LSLPHKEGSERPSSTRDLRPALFPPCQRYVRRFFRSTIRLLLAPVSLDAESSMPSSPLGRLLRFLLPGVLVLDMYRVAFLSVIFFPPSPLNRRRGDRFVEDPQAAAGSYISPVPVPPP